MVRRIIQITESQAEMLRERAREQGVSVSELVRRGIDMVLRSGMSNTEIRRRAKKAVGYVYSGDTDVSVRHDDYLAEAYCQ
ncbi:MAG: ribbon-helix-helix domain-containing protein [Armatimonadetes bacterium]|nr:ribbon-helix-helix domain-containing protein [Armatimonadota bacterium]